MRLTRRRKPDKWRKKSVVKVREKDEENEEKKSIFSVKIQLIQFMNNYPSIYILIVEWTWNTHRASHILENLRITHSPIVLEINFFFDDTQTNQNLQFHSAIN